MRGRIAFSILVFLLATVCSVAPFFEGMTHAAAAPPAGMEVHRHITHSPYSGVESPYPGWSGWLDVVVANGHLSLHCWYSYAFGDTRWTERVAVDDAVWVYEDAGGYYDSYFLGPISYDVTRTEEYDVDWPEWLPGTTPAHVCDLVEGTGVESHLGIGICPCGDGGIAGLLVPLPWGYDHLTRRVYCADGTVHCYEQDVLRQTGEGLQLLLTPPDDEVVDPLTDDPLTSMQYLVTPEGLAWEPERLARAGRPVAAAAADGATRLLIRSASGGPATVTFTLGGPGRLSRLDGSERGLSLTVDAVAAAGQHYAYCLYWAPDGLPQGSDQSPPFDIQVTKQAGDGSLYTLSHHLTLYQPPVVLLHGLWSDENMWGKLRQWLLASGGFRWVSAHHYPNASGLGYNECEVLDAVQDACAMARSEGVAACRADIIGHSMGGVLGRYWGRATNGLYCGRRNFYQGDIRRLITMNSPHYGTEIADLLYDEGRDPVWGPVVTLAFSMAKHPIDRGAIEDLRWGSPRLRTMGASTVRGHALVGTVDLSLNDTWTAIDYIIQGKKTWLTLVAGVMGELLGINYDTSALFGGACHDLVVNCESQQGGMGTGTQTAYHGSDFWHSAAADAGLNAGRCISLLSEPDQDAAFAEFPALPELWPGAPLGSPGAVPPHPAELPPPTLSITSPSQGSLVAPGEQLLATVQTPTGTAVAVTVVVGPDAYAVSPPSDPWHVSLAVPLEASGDYPIMALARLADGGCAYSPEVHLQVSLTGREPIRLRFWQEALALETRHQTGIMCLADCADGMTRVLAGASQGLSFRSTDSSVAAVDSDGNVTALAPGTCAIVAEWHDLLALLAVTVRQPAPEFPDVPPSGWAFYEIRSVLRAGIVQGYPDGTYHPADPVTRDQMAVYIARSLAGGDAYVPSGPATPSFSDVPTDHWAYQHIEYAVSQTVVKGYDNGTYQPDLVVDRGQMAVFVARAMVVPSGDAGIPDPTGDPTFSDVAAGFWAYKQVEYCVAQGVVTGYDDGTYRPYNPVTRDQMAVYVQRAFRLPM